MNVGDSIRQAINDWEQGELDSAMLHACNAVDGTARKIYLGLGSNVRFTQLLRDNYKILGAMGAPGIDLVETRFPVSVPNPKATGGQPDIADVIYGIHRCYHGHGEELPNGFELIQDVAGEARITRMTVEQGKVRFSDRIIFGLIAMAVLSPVNHDQIAPDSYCLTYGNATKLIINEWWGRANDFLQIIALDPPPASVKLDFGDWMP